MRTFSAHGRRPWAAPMLAATVLAALCSSATARTSWSVDLNVGLPIVGASVYSAPAYGGGYVSALPAGAVSVQVAGGRYWRHGGTYYRPYYGGWYGPRWVIVPPPVVVAAPVVTEPVVVTAPQPATPARPDPIIYPRNGQDANQTEFDRQECNRWATTQPAALADASVFHRAVEACMDGRGYSMK